MKTGQRRTRHRLKGLLIGLALSAPASSALAEGFDLQQFNPMPDQQRNFFSTSSAEVAPHMSWQGFALFNYAHAPLVLRDAEGRRVEAIVGSQSTLNLLGSIGFADIFEIGLDVPLVVNPVGGDQALAGIAPSDASVGIGDLRLVPKVSLFNTRGEAGTSGVALAALADVFLPVGQSSAMQGGDLRGHFRLAFDAIVGPDLHLGANLGYLVRPAAQLMNLEVNDAMTWSLAAEIPVSERVRLTGELFGKATFAAEALGREEFPTEFLLGGKYKSGSLYMQAGGGAGLVSGYGTPDFRLFMGIGLALDQPVAIVEEPISEPIVVAPKPEPEPEPEPEPKPKPEPEPKPEPAPVVLVVPEPEPEPKVAEIDTTKRQIVITDRVHFQTNSDVIEPQSYRVLNQVARIIEQNPHLRVRVEGYTDSRGGADLNLELSKRRALSVKRYLTAQGISERRLDSEGLGQGNPIATNHSEPGRAANRRVEFHILEP
ncbi:MAG: OmpA family protein [Bradymonadaceae bacterium]|nr:OmpA family protein [Lujinxingiaceae bacterium]